MQPTQDASGRRRDPQAWRRGERRRSMSALPRTAPEDPLVAFLAIAEALEASAQACHGVGDACAASARAMRAFASGAVVPDGTKPAEKELTIAAVAALLGISTWDTARPCRPCTRTCSSG